MIYFYPWSLSFWALLCTFFVDYVFLEHIYWSPSAEMRRTMHYFPTWYAYYYNLDELKNFANGLIFLWTKGHSGWVLMSLVWTLFLRQFLPISGVYYVEILAGRTLGFFFGLILAWSTEIAGAVVCYIFNTKAQHPDWRPDCFWIHLLAIFDDQKTASVNCNRQPAPVALGQMLPTKSLAALVVLRCCSPVPNWLLNAYLIEAGIPFTEYICSAMVAATPHLAYSIYVGSQLDSYTKLFDYRPSVFYLCLAAWFVARAALKRTVKLRARCNQIADDDPPELASGQYGFWVRIPGLAMSWTW